MVTKEKYLEKTEIKVKNLLAELYESESKAQKHIMLLKEKMEQELSQEKKHYDEISKKRKELENMFQKLKNAGDKHWEKMQNDFDLLLKYVEGDKETFIQQAESVLEDLGIKINQIEEKAVDAASDAKEELVKKAEELKISREELQNKIDSIREDTSDRWRDIKHWFIEQSKTVKEYVSTFGDF